MKIKPLLAVTTAVILSVFCHSALAEEEYELTKVAEISTKTELGKERFDKVKEKMISRKTTVSNFSLILTEDVILEIFSVKTPNGVCNTKELLKGGLKHGYRPAMASEVLSLDKTGDKALANIPILALGTTFTGKSGIVTILSVTYPNVEERKSEQMAMRFLTGVNSTFKVDMYLVALVGKKD